MIVFNGQNATLDVDLGPLNTLKNFAASVSGLVAGDKIGVPGFAVTSAVLNAQNQLVVATDGGVSFTFSLTGNYLGEAFAVNGSNITAIQVFAPTVTLPTAGQSWLKGQSLSYSLSANTFNDPQGQTLTYTASLSNGQALSAIGLSFNSTTATFSGTPSALGAFPITVTATNTSGLSASETFTATVIGQPIVASQTPAQTWQQGQPVSFALPAGTFSDPNGQPLTYAATLAGGQSLSTIGLGFDGTTATFSGTPGTLGANSITVTATDASGQSVSETFVATILGAPVIAKQTPNQQWQTGQSVSFVLPAQTFTDPNGQTLSLAAALSDGRALSAIGLMFDPSTGAFSGVPSAAGTNTIKVTATDSGGLAVSETFVATVHGTPVVAAQTANQVWDRGHQVSFALPTGTFNDPNGETLTYAATLTNGRPLSSIGLSFDPATATFTGTPKASATGTITVTATDSSGLSGSEAFAYNIVAGVTLESRTADQHWKSGVSTSFQLASNTFGHDPKDPVTETAFVVSAHGKQSALPSWLSFDAATGTFSGRPTTSATIKLAIEVVAKDGAGSTATDSFHLVVSKSGHVELVGLHTFPGHHDI